MSRAFDETDLLCINTVRTLSLDAVEKAKSGHPGLPLGCAPLAHVLWSRHLRFNPADPHWPGRDRFVLSAGHGCMLLYSLLHLTGYDLSIEELERFRQWGSKTPGHPEYRHTEGVETTTGPLGQGAATSIGMAIAGKHLGARYGDPAGLPRVRDRLRRRPDGGRLRRGLVARRPPRPRQPGVPLRRQPRLDRRRHRDRLHRGPGERYDAYGWKTSRVDDGNDLDELDAAITAAIAVEGQPAFISVSTIIGYGSRDAGTHRAHSDARGPEQQAETKRTLGFDPDKFFFVPEAAQQRYERDRAPGRRDSRPRGSATSTGSQMRRSFAGSTRKRYLALELTPFMPDDGPIATRAASGKVLAQLAKQVPQLMGGSADLTPSNNTLPPDWTDFQPATPEGRYLRFGVREHGMTAALNGLALSNIRPYGGTFFNFMDYAKPAVRLAGLMGIPSVFVYTHDSIGLGEDGPTHQPIEQLATLRATPHITVFRPADANETSVGWRIAMERDTPTALVLTRQGLPILDASACRWPAPRRAATCWRATTIPRCS